jgi:hypothetical protein
MQKKKKKTKTKKTKKKKKQKGKQGRMFVVISNTSDHDHCLQKMESKIIYLFSF